MIFKMSGKRIMNDLNFREFFSPYDLLRQRESAAGMAFQVLGHASDDLRYHTEMLYRGVFQDVFLSGLDKSDEEPWSCYWSAGNEYSLFGEAEKEEENLLLEAMWSRLCPGESPGEDDRRLFFILSAGYFLAGKTLEEVPLNWEEARKAYERGREKPTISETDKNMEEAPLPRKEIRVRSEYTLTTREDPDFPEIPEIGDVILEARKKPYRLQLKSALSETETIVPRRLKAAPHWQGDPSVQVTVEAYRGDKLLTTETILVGDYRVCNFAGKEPVWLHPVAVQSGKACMTREKDKLILTYPDKPDKKLDCSGQTILSFAPEADGDHWVILSDSGLDYNQYSMASTHRTKLRNAHNLVEVQLRSESVLMLLDNRGKLISTSQVHADLQDKSFPCLQTIDR